MPPDDPLLERLRVLPTPPLDEAVSKRVLSRAQARLAESRPSAFRATLELLWSRAIAPALVTATVAGYLGWAVSAASAVYR
jgi:hypothetical protein